jgi:GNAT superfamily N-acetyltransferase
MITTQTTSVTPEKDKNGKAIIVKTINRIGGSEIYTFFLRQMADLIDAGHSNPTTTWEDDHGAVYATEEDGTILGHIVYFHNPEKKMLWITLSAVREDARGRGIYTKLHRYLEHIGRTLGCTSIQSTVHVNNGVRIASGMKFGLKAQYLLMNQPL